MLRRVVFGKGSRWIALAACWVFITDCTYALDDKDLRKIGFVKVVDSSSEGPAEENGSENNGTKKNDEAKQSRKYLDHLILGEADFSFTEALIRKHQKSYPDLPKHIIATELRSMETLARGYPDTFFMHMAALHRLGMAYQGRVARPQYSDERYPNFADEYRYWHRVCLEEGELSGHRCRINNVANPETGMIVTGVDATRLHEIFPMVYNGGTVSGFHFERIHFNFPMPPDGFSKVPMHPDSSEEVLAVQKLMHDFFVSASRIQIAGDRIHVTIPDGWETSYGIIDAGSENNYRLIKVHRFANRSYLKISGDTTEEVLERYPGYLHNVNIGVNADEIAEDTKKRVRDGREYVFEKFDGGQILVDSIVKTDDESSESSDSSDYLDYDWYTGDDMNRLMDHYFGQTAWMQAINVDDLSQNLADRERLIANVEDNVPQLLIPLNVGEGVGNHWVGLYINRMPDQDGIIQVFYFDSFGNPMPRRLQTILREIYISRGEVIFYQNNRPYQVDSCSCGAWVIEFFRNMHQIISPGGNVKPLFMNGFDISSARERHNAILHPNH